jgi:hypothetical protein
VLNRRGHNVAGHNQNHFTAKDVKGAKEIRIITAESAEYAENRREEIGDFEAIWNVRKKDDFEALAMQKALTKKG